LKFEDLKQEGRICTNYACLLLYINAKSKTILYRDARKEAEEEKEIKSSLFELQ